MSLFTIKNRFFSDLTGKNPSFVASKWLLDKTPHIFHGKRTLYIEWKEIFAKKIGVDGHAISIVGSASTGFSLNPSKKYRHFNENSDVDVAIISNHYFEISWHHLRNLGSKLYRLPPNQKAAVYDHVHRLIYWGTIATDKILPLFPYGRQWFNILTDMAFISPTTDREINIRIYKDFESLRAYQINNLITLKQNRLQPTTNEEVLLNESLS